MWEAIRKERAHYVTAGARRAQEWAMKKSKSALCNHSARRAQEWAMTTYPCHLGGPQRSMRGMKSEVGSKGGSKLFNMFFAYWKTPEKSEHFE